MKPSFNCKNYEDNSCLNNDSDWESPILTSYMIDEILRFKGSLQGGTIRFVKRNEYVIVSQNGKCPFLKKGDKCEIKEALKGK